MKIIDHTELNDIYNIVMSNNIIENDKLIMINISLKQWKKEFDERVDQELFKKNKRIWLQNRLNKND